MPSQKSSPTSENRQVDRRDLRPAFASRAGAALVARGRGSRRARSSRPRVPAQRPKPPSSERSRATEPNRSVHGSALGRRMGADLVARAPTRSRRRQGHELGRGQNHRRRWSTSVIGRTSFVIVDIRRRSLFADASERKSAVRDHPRSGRSSSIASMSTTRAGSRARERRSKLGIATAGSTSASTSVGDTRVSGLLPLPHHVKSGTGPLVQPLRISRTPKAARRR